MNIGGHFLNGRIVYPAPKEGSGARCSTGRMFGHSEVIQVGPISNDRLAGSDLRLVSIDS